MNDYYSDKTRINNSGIGWFLKSPKEFYERTNNGISIDTASTRFGTDIHCYILQPDEFKRTYKIRDFEAPKIQQQKDFCSAMVCYMKNKTFSLSEIRELAIRAYTKSYTTTGKSIKTITTSAIDMLIRYKSFIQQSLHEDMKLISWPHFIRIQRLAKLVKSNKYAKELLDKPGNCEFHINWERNGVECKSLLDKVCIDTDAKEITLIDLKTTASISDFKHSIKEYGYRRQMMFYKLAIWHYMKNVMLENPDEYKFSCRIIAIQTSDIPLVEVFGFTVEELQKEIPVIDYAIERIDWHKQNNLWEHSKEYYEDDGITYVTLD